MWEATVTAPTGSGVSGATRETVHFQQSCDINVGLMLCSHVTCISVLCFMASLVAQIVKNLPAMQETRARPLGQEDALEKRMATKPVFLSGELHGQRT